MWSRQRLTILWAVQNCGFPNMMGSVMKQMLNFSCGTAVRALESSFCARRTFPEPYTEIIGVVDGLE
jgi:hypothetical protein